VILDPLNQTKTGDIFHDPSFPKSLFAACFPAYFHRLRHRCTPNPGPNYSLRESGGSTTYHPKIDRALSGAPQGGIFTLEEKMVSPVKRLHKRIKPGKFKA
jgi:hypothetical protein